MDSSHLDPFSAADARIRQVQDAKDMQQIVFERANRAGTGPPPYDFLELIGKGSFGRVYKCKDRITRDIVAVKIIDVDELDYHLDNSQKDAAIDDFVKEVNTLKQVKDSNAKNINQIREAFDLYSQLWIVSDYCSGGSVHTLMKASDQPGLDERYIIPIARELAVALKHVHDAGVIHRDIKCGNVLISEDGHLQLCDFGVSAVIENDASKRSTIIGTPYWMAPEMHQDDDQEYGQEIDCWAYGCTLFEMATGMPPNHKFHPTYLKQVLKSAPRLEEDHFSPGLRDFVAFCLQEDPDDRPKAQQIVEHPYIANTEDEYPTSSLQSLIVRYVQWETKGGQRMSLFNAMGAAAPQFTDHQDSEENWIFSTTDDFDKGYEQRYSRMLGGIAEMDFAEKTPESLPAEIELPGGPSKKLSPFEAAKEEQRAHRGERYLERLFDAEKDPYDYDETKMVDEDQPLSDLPLRNLSDDRAANRETLIDLDTSGLDMPTFNFDFSDVPTLKANRKSSVPNLGDMDDGDYYDPQDQATKRATKDWKFPGFAAPGVDDAKRATKDWKFPSLTAEDADNKKRATKDWKFPSLAHTTKASLDQGNRRTMDWTFSNAQPMPEDAEADFSLVSQTIEEEPFRPPMPRMTTEPVMAAPDIDHPLQLSLDTGAAGDRESRPMIDLDFANGYQPSLSLDQQQNGLDITRSISPVSATQSLASIGPFDLEQDPERKADDMQRYPQQGMSGSNGSLSVAERRLSRLQKSGKSSFGAHLLPSRARGASVDSTASSLVDEACDESIYGKQYSRNMNARMRDQLRAGLQRSASAQNRHSRNLTDESYGDADTDGPYVANNNHHPFNRSASAMSAISYETDSSWHEERRTIRTPSSFPELMPPQAKVLVEGAAPDAILEELDKMLGTAQQAFAYTSMLLRSREMDLEGDNPVDSATEAGPLDMTSEEETELANFS